MYRASIVIQHKNANYHDFAKVFLLLIFYDIRKGNLYSALTLNAYVWFPTNKSMN